MDDVAAISDYLAGELSPEEVAAFEARMAEDESFRERVEAQRQQLLLLKAAHRADLKAQLRKDLIPISPAAQKTFPIWRLVAAAAAILLLLLWFQPWKSQDTPEALAMSYLEPYPVVTDRSNEFSEDSLFFTALLLYQNGQYERAAPLLASVGAENPLAKLYQGECLLQTSQYEAALPIFASLESDPLFGEAAMWRYALATILAGQPEDAQEYLKTLVRKEGYKSKESQALLEVIP